MKMIPTQQDIQAFGTLLKPAGDLIGKQFQKAGQTKLARNVRKTGDSVKSNLSNLKSISSDTISRCTDRLKLFSMKNPILSNKMHLQHIKPLSKKMLSSIQSQSQQRALNKLNENESTRPLDITIQKRAMLTTTLQSLKAECQLDQSALKDAQKDIDILKSKLNEAESIVGEDGEKVLHKLEKNRTDEEGKYKEKWTAKKDFRNSQLESKKKILNKYKENESTITHNKYQIETLEAEVLALEKKLDRATARLENPKDSSKRIQSKTDRTAKKIDYINDTTHLIAPLKNKIADKIATLEKNQLALAKKEITTVLIDKFLNPPVGYNIPEVPNFISGTCKDFKNFCEINKENLTDLVKEKIPDIFNDQKSMIADSIMQKLSNKQISDTASLDTLREAIIPALDTPSDSAVTIRMLLDIGKTNPAEKARKYEDISQKILKTFIDDLHILKINDTEKNAFNGGDTNLNKAINECSKSIVTDFPLVFQHGIQTAKTYEGWDQFIATVKTKLPELNEQSISDDIKSGSKLEQLLTCLPTAFSEAAQSDGFIPQIQHNHLNEYLANTLFEGSQKNLTPEKITELQNTYKDAGMDLKPLPALPNASHTDSLTSKPLPALPNASHTDSLTSKPLPALPEKLDDNSESIHSKDKESRELSSEDNNAKLAELAQLNGMLLDQLNNDDQKQSPVDSGFEDMSSNDDNESIISNSDSFVSATSSLFNDSESFVSATSSLRDDNERV